MVSVSEIRNGQRTEGPATVLAIGTANPSNCVDQSTYADYYFRITNSEHMTDLKKKFQRERTQIKNRHMYLTEEILKENPNMCAYKAPSLDAREDMMIREVPRVGKEAATKAIKEWGQPMSKITHLIFCTTSGVVLPGVDYELIILLGLDPSVKRYMMYHQGCFAGGTVLRLAKDLAENNKDARVLIVCSENTSITFRGPSETDMDSLVGQALFADGAAAIIIGSDPVPEVEKPIFEIVSTDQKLVPGSHKAIGGLLREVGLTFYLNKSVPDIISQNINDALSKAFDPLGISDYNSIFWIAHPGGRAILDQRSFAIEKTQLIEKMVSVSEIRNAQRAEGPATVLAIGTANPSNCVDQSTYADYYFRIKNRHMYLTEEILKENPNICVYKAPSLDAREDMMIREVPRVGKEAATKAIKEWGRPMSEITHLIFCTTSGVALPGVDYELIVLLGLDPSVKRYMMYHQGCFAGGTVLRLAKDLAENNKDARVLIVCSENTSITFRGPSETDMDSLVGQALFADGAAAIIIGSDPVPEVEKPLFEIVSTDQKLVPGSHGAIGGLLREVGLTFYLNKSVPDIISQNINDALSKAFDPLGISDYNSIFWIAHPGGRAILDQVEQKVNLKPEKMKATRDVLSNYGNMSSACVFFIMDLMRKKSLEEGLKTTGEGLDWGVLFGFGPGLTIETVVLRSVAI
ncbi:hypothetical protein Ahy_B04g069103 isoform A [Arachis hypogaea]|uniref:trihydroxystilbene synthase n=1 Tax=Arachis hypogaea TaxID=3818 RepID=A0A444ZBQ1_ARAHY|nr:hypothetical protein Ahy_B04g069103 isoform A [Arachis hypogaea]